MTRVGTVAGAVLPVVLLRRSAYPLERAAAAQHQPTANSAFLVLTAFAPACWMVIVALPIQIAAVGIVTVPSVVFRIIAMNPGLAAIAEEVEIHPAVLVENVF